MLTGITQNPSIKMPKKGSLWEGAKHLLSGAWKNRDAIAGIAANIAATSANFAMGPTGPVKG